MEVAYIRQIFSNNLFVRLHGGEGWEGSLSIAG